MKIFTLWHEGDDGDAPWIVDAVDEYTIYNHGEFPPPYAYKRSLAEHRELIIDVPEKAVRALFDSPEVIAKVVVEKQKELHWHYDNNNRPEMMIHTGCGREVLVIEGRYICECGAQSEIGR